MNVKIKKEMLGSIGILLLAPLFLCFHIGCSENASSKNVTQPAFSPDPGFYNTVVSVSLSSETVDAKIFYTISRGTISTPPLDPTDPSTGDIQYSTVIQLSTNKSVTKIKAIAIKPGMQDSAVSEATYTIDFSTATAVWGNAIWGIHKW